MGTTSARTPSSAPAIAAAAAVIALFAAGCGSSSSSSTASGTSTAQASASSSSTSSAAPKLHLKILSPRHDSHTGSAVTVRVSLSGGEAGGSKAVRYVLDGHLVRRGSRTLVYHGLRPGRQHLVVMLASDRGVRGSTVFVVRTPAPAPVATTPAPAPTTTMSTPPPTTSSPPPSSGIPQGNGGDGDGDNNGGPTDGDGNI